MVDKKKNQWILVIGAIVLVYLVYQSGGVPFFGSMVMFEEGNEIQFSAAGTSTSKEIDPATGLNITTDIPAVTDISRYLTLQSKYITSAKIRIYGTDSITNAKMDILHNDVLTNAWAQTATFTEVEEVDVQSPLAFNASQGDVVEFKFHSDTPGSIIVSSFDVEWGPTNDQIILCDTTQGTFDEATVSCLCPSDSTSFSWETGCIFPETETETGTGGGSGTIVAPSPEPATELQTTKAPAPQYFTLKLIILTILLGLLIYYFAYEKDDGNKKKGFF